MITDDMICEIDTWTSLAIKKLIHRWLHNTDYLTWYVQHSYCCARIVVHSLFWSDLYDTKVYGVGSFVLSLVITTSYIRGGNEIQKFFLKIHYIPVKFEI